MERVRYNIDKQFDSFVGAMTDIRINRARKVILNSGASKEQFKFLAIDLIEEIQNESLDLQKNRTSDMIEAWSISLNNHTWHDELISFCKSKDNITSAYAVSNGEKEEFIIIVDDVTDDSVLEYNTFAFDLRHKYSTIHDFMVLDLSMEKGINSMFDKQEKIYERGHKVAKDI